MFHMQAESSSPDVTNIDESGENRQQRTPNLEGWTKLHKTEHVWKRKSKNWNIVDFNLELVIKVIYKGTFVSIQTLFLFFFSNMI